MQIYEPRSVVVGVETVPGSPTNTAHVSYRTEPFQVGQAVDILPVVERDTIHLRVLATVTEFLGYDDPRGVTPAPGSVTGQSGLPSAVLPLPRVRVRSTATATEADAKSLPSGATSAGSVLTGPWLGAVARSGETVVLRGPQVTEVVRYSDKVPVLGNVPLLGRLFRREGTSSIAKRFYLFVTPVLEKAPDLRPPTAGSTRP